MASTQSGSFERRPIASMTRSAAIVSPFVVRAPVMWGTPFAAEGPLSNSATVTPRLIDITRSAARATANSIVTRRPVTVTKRSSPSRRARSGIDGGRSALTSNMIQPASNSSCLTSGKWRSRRCRPAAWRKCGCRNWATPRRSQLCHASFGEFGSGSSSRSKTMTSWPCSASIIAVERPMTPPPRTSIRAIPPPPFNGRVWDSP